MDFQKIREQVIEASLDLQRKQLIRGTSGNITIRTGDPDLIAITPTSIPYEKLTPDMIPIVDLKGRQVEGSCKPSSELPMHLAILKARPDVGAVVHTHSRFATVLSILGIDLPIVTIPLMLYAPSPAPLVPFKLPGSAELGEAAVRYLGENGTGLLLEHHGLVAVGADIDKAMTAAEYIEEGAEIAYYCQLAAGKIDAIPDDKVEELRRILESGRAL